MINKRLFALMADARKYVFAQVGWQWAGLLCSVFIMFRLGQTADALQQAVLAALPETAALLIAAALLRALCARNAAHCSCLAGAAVKSRLRCLLFEKLSRLGPAYHEQVPTAEAVQLMSEGIEQLETYFGRYLPQLFYSLLAPLTLFLALCRISLRASLVLLLCVPLIPVTIVLVQKIAKRLLGKYWDSYTALGDSFLENLQGLTTLKIYGADGRKAAEMDAEAESFRKITMKVLMMQLNSIVVMDLVAYGGAALGMMLAVLSCRSGQASLGQALTILLLASEFFIPMRLLGSFFHIAMNGMAASDKLFRILDLEAPVSGREMLSGAAFSVALRGLSFSYDGEREVLKDISLTIPEKGLVSLVGMSGSGKSTIAALLTGQKKGYRGEISLCYHAGSATAGLAGKDRQLRLEDIAPESLQRSITLLGHDSMMFAGTVEENLRMADATASEETLIHALQQACLWDFLSRGEGLKTKLTEGGSNLSGGQRQRLALARALLRDSPLYIFDEASSNIDAESEAAILRVIRTLSERHAVLQITHRLSNARDSAQIYVLKQGALLESGSFEALLATKGEFARLYEEQSLLEHYGQQERRKDAQIGN